MSVKVVEADLILVSIQLFSSEAYQRHFDSLSKPGLQVWDTSSLEKRTEMEADIDPLVSNELWQHGESSDTFEQGDVVEMHGLIAKAHLNGRRGQLIGWQEDTQRWSCLLGQSTKGCKSMTRKGIKDGKRQRGRPDSGWAGFGTLCNEGVKQREPTSLLPKTAFSRCLSQLRLE